MHRPPLKEAVLRSGRLLLQGRFDLSFDQLGFHFENLPFKKRLNMVIQGAQLSLRPRQRVGLPVIVQVEPTNHCNLGCLTCPTGAGLIRRPQTMMPLDMFKRIVDQVKHHAYLLVFWSWGEPFIHPDACRMIRYAKDSGLQVHTSTNGHFFHTGERARAVVDSGLDSVIVAVDGLDPETYVTYRKGGDFKRVVASIENLVSARRQAGVSHPRITFRFIVMKHNEHQIPQVRPFARKLGVDAVSLRSAVVERSEINLEQDLAPRDESYQLYDYRNDSPSRSERIHTTRFYCHRPYANLTIFSNGDVVACENDYDATRPFGNVADAPLRILLSSARARKFLDIFRRQPDEYAFCRSCDFRDMKLESANVDTQVFADADDSLTDPS